MNVFLLRNGGPISVTECEAKTCSGWGFYSRFGKIRVPTQIGHLQSVFWFDVEQLDEI